MKSRILVAGFVIVFIAGVCCAQTLIQPQKANERWIGVWQGQLDGQPGVTITLVEDNGRMSGTAVFNIVSREGQPHVIASEPHMVLATNTEGDTLHFQIKAFQNTRDLAFDMKATADDKAHLQCLNCDDSSETDVVRSPVYAKKQ